MRTQLRALIAPGLILLSIMSATIVLRSISVYFIQQDFQSAADNESRRVADLLKSYLNARMVALNHVALSLTIDPGLTADVFHTQLR